MPLLEFLIEWFVQIILEGLIFGGIRRIGRGINYLKDRLCGKKKPADPMKALEGKYLYQEVELTENLHSGLSVGRKGAVWEIIDRDTVFAEFYDEKGNQVEWNGETVFEVGIHQLKLKSNKM